MSEKKENEEIKEETKGLLSRFLDGDGPIRNFIKQGGLTESNLADEQKKLIQSFREGLAQALGIPPEYIKEEPITRWFFEFARAFVKPEHINETITPPLRRVNLFGQEIGQIIREGIERIDEEEPAKERLIEKVIKNDKIPSKTEEPRSDISL